MCCLEDIKTPIQVTQLFCGEKVFFSFLWRLFLLLKVYTFYYPMLVLNAFEAISEGLKLKMFRGSMPPDSPRGTLQRIPSQIPAPAPAPAPHFKLALHFSLRQPKLSPLETCPSGSHLVCLLFASQLPIKNLATGLNRIQS